MITNHLLQDDPRMFKWHEVAQDTLDTWLEMLEEEGVDEYERPTWTFNDRSWARTVVITFDSHFHSGIHRIVFVKDDYAIKIDRHDGSANLNEWNRWKRLSREAKAHALEPYCMTPCGTVMIVEKLRPLEGASEREMVQKQRALICADHPELNRVPDSFSIENWGFRGNEVVLLDLAGY